MVKKSKKFGFSLAETIILVTILAVAVAASTPILSRKIINTTDAGETLTGAAHGRYEAYMKEIVTFPNSPDGNISYEKTIDEKGMGKGSNKIVVFRRLDDTEFYDVTSNAPIVDSSGVYKETLYEQIDNAKGKTDTNGAITTVTFNGKEYPVGGKIIVENADLIYKSGCIKNTTPQNFIRAGQSGCSAKNITLPNNTHRIIEGNITKLYSKTLNSNKLWHLDVNKPGTYTSNVTSIPWERLYSGNNLTADRPITPIDGKYIGSFNPGSKAKNVVVHAVGGGGAGGGLTKNDNFAKRPNNMTDPELSKLKSELAQRFREATGVTASEYPDNVLVKIKNTAGMNDATRFNQIFDVDNEDGDGKNYIVINTNTGRIYGKFDVREGKLRAYPNEILRYTKTIGTQSQPAIVYDMPKWLDFDSIGESFYTGAVGCGTAGGKGGDLRINTTFNIHTSNKCCNLTSACINEQTDNCYVRTDSYDCKCKEQTNCSQAGKIDIEKTKKQFGITGFGVGVNGFNEDMSANGSSSAPAKTCTTRTVCDTCYKDIYEDRNICKKRACTYTCVPPYNSDYETTDGSECSNAGGCPAYDQAENFNSASCAHNYPGGSGGAPGACATVCHKITEPIETTYYCTTNGGSPGANTTITAGSANVSVTVHHGAMGNTCTVKAGNQEGYSQGGQGGQAFTMIAFTIPGDSYFNQTHYIPSQYANLLEPFNSISNPTTTYDATLPMIQLAPCCGNQGGKGKDGRKGSSSGNTCANTTGIGSTTGLYNHIYVWSVPFRTNKLTFGESGEIGEYKTSKIEEVNGEITVELGKGGVWSADTWKFDDASVSKQAPNGGDTIVKMNNKTVLTAKGGKGGSPSIPTEEYELCVPSPSAPAECKMSENREAEGIDCCHKEQGTRSTRDIIENAIKMNPFENIKSITGNSTIVGIGLGRGGEGAGTRAGVEEVNNLARANQKKATLRFTNVSADTTNLSFNDLHLINRFLESLGYNEDASKPDEKYKNKLFAPSSLNFKGGDGAVIITW